MPITPLRLIGLLWLLWGAYWWIASIGRPPARRRQPALERVAHVALMGVGFVLFYAEDPRFGLLDARFLPWRPVEPYLGIALTAAGIALAVWARLHLGRNWSAEVTIREDHRLIRTGPYARIRHPIYTGILLALLGTAVAIDEFRAIAGFAVITLGFTLKARREESFLAEEFPGAFEEHRRRTGFLLPHVGPR